MAEVMVQIKFSNRIFPRIYRVEGSDFETIKNTIKGGGAKFDGLTRRWSLTSKAALEELKSKFSVSNADFVCGGQYFDDVRFVADAGRVIYVGKGEYADKDARAKLHALQAAYNMSDQALAEMVKDLDK